MRRLLSISGQFLVALAVLWLGTHALELVLPAGVVVAVIGIKGTAHRLTSVDLLANPFGQITPRNMLRNVQHHGVFIRLRADVSIAGGTTNGTLRNRGLLSALLRNIYVNENGDRVTEIDPRVLRVMGAAMAPRVQSQATALADGSVQANTILEDFLPLHFALPILANPFETAYLERNSDQELSLEFETVTAAREALLEGCDRTVTVNAFTAEVVQVVDRRTGRLPLFIPVYRPIASEVITGAVSDLEIPLKPKGYIGLLVVQQLVGSAAGVGYEVGDIMDSLEVRGSTVKVFEGRITDDFYRQFMEHLPGFGGTVPAGYTVIPFIRSGRLGNMWNPLRDPQLTAHVDVDGLSAVAGTNRLRFWALELLRDPQTTRELPPQLQG